MKELNRIKSPIFFFFFCVCVFCFQRLPFRFLLICKKIHVILFTPKMLSAAVVIGTFRVKKIKYFKISSADIQIQQLNSHCNLETP